MESLWANSRVSRPRKSVHTTIHRTISSLRKLNILAGREPSRGYKCSWLMWSPVKGRWTFLRNDVFLSCGESLFPASGDIPAKQTGYLCPQGERGSNTNFNCAIFFSTQPHSLQPVCSVISISRFHFNNLSKSAQKSS